MAKIVVDNSAGVSGKAQKADKAAKAAKASASAKASPMAPAAKAPAAVKTPAKGRSRLKSLVPHSSSGDSSRSSTSAAPRGAVSAKPTGRVRTFFREVRIEMKKVTWPPRKELITSTGVVIIAVAIAAIFIGVFDYIWMVIMDAVGLG